MTAGESIESCHVRACTLIASVHSLNIEDDIKNEDDLKNEDNLKN